MKRTLCVLFFSLTMFACNDAENPSSAKESNKSIRYGSNHGKYLAIKGTKIYYEEYGEGIPLLLLHQGLGSIENLAGIIPELSKHFRVIVPDAPGRGRSEHADSLSGELLAEYNSQVIDQLNLDSAYVMGWSTGGNTSLLLAANRPDKIKKVLSGASNSKASGVRQEARDMLKEYSIEAVKEDKDWLENYQRLNPEPEKWIKFWEDNQKTWEREIKIPDDKIAKIKVPVLLIRGDRDMIKLDHTISIFEALQDGQLCIYPNVGHDMPDEREDALCRIAVEFFNESKVNRH